MDILFNKDGAPLMLSAKSFFAATTGVPKEALDEIKKKQKKVADTKTDQDFTRLDGIELLSWGSNNDFPQWADKIITSTSVLNSGLKFIRNFTLGQGIFACKVVGYDPDGNEILEQYPDPAPQQLVNSPKIRRYMEKAGRDYFKYGSSAVQLIPNVDGDKVVGLNPINAYFFRLSTRDVKTGAEKCIISGKFPDNPSKSEFEAIDVLMDYDAELDLDLRRYNGKGKESVIFMIRDSWSNKDTYSEPVWLSAYLAGWIDIAKSVPTYLQKVYKNQATWKWHIQIPYKFWDRKFPLAEFDDVTKRQEAIEKYMDDIETNLLGSENAEKPLFTFYESNDNGKIEEEWKITPLDNKSKEGDKLVTSAAANSEILFALMINPNVLGAGMPGGTYAGNQGGSNIREAFLVNVANAWVDRQNLLDPIEITLRYNGYSDIVLRYRNTVLTTLDKGAGTKKTLS
ncbi:MAG: hypothetical protein PHU68_01200 [Paludibacter sp.]|nr:hypothetical protein [Paludibacter sp.]